MKILLMNRSYYPNIGGIENSLYYLSRECDKLGHCVTIFTREISREYPARKEYANIVTYPTFRFNKLSLPVLPLLYKRKLKNWIKKNRLQIEAEKIICRDPMMGLAYSEVFPEADIIYIPAVVIKYYNKGIRNFTSIYNFVKECLRYSQLKIEEKQQKKIFSISNKVVVFSENVKKQLIEGKLCKKEKIVICKPGVADKFKVEKNKTKSINENVEFLFVGRLVVEKNLKMLIEAFGKLSNKKSRLIIVGDGAQKDELEHLSKEMSLEDRVVFVGESNEPEKYYSKAHFFVIPSTYESFGQVVIEAMSSGTPVIGFPTIKGKTMTAISELVINDKTGFVCNDFSCDALRDCMEKAFDLAMNPNRYNAMTEAATEFIEQKCSWNNLASTCINNS